MNCSVFKFFWGELGGLEAQVVALCAQAQPKLQFVWDLVGRCEAFGMHMICMLTRFIFRINVV